jgi:EAL domain-containing protein (putative c-di-GMP-specific phosphodiesterase class I)
LRDFEEYKKEQGQYVCSILLFEFMNMDTVNRYVSFEVGIQALIKLLEEAEAAFPRGLIYSLPPSQFVVFLRDTDDQTAGQLARDFIGKLKQPIYVQDLPVAIIVKGGLVSVPLHGTETEDIIEKLAKALDQAEKSHYELVTYDEKFAAESREHYNTLISLYRAVQNDNFTLVYQPKVDLKNQEMAGVEALLRWNDSTYSDIPIADVIKIAEDAEFISQISRWVIKHAILQLKEWKSEGIHTRIAINLSSRDLKDTSILEFTKECLEAHQIDPSYLEFELTERTIIEDEATLLEVLNEIRKTGIKVSLDDYGTGHNSLKYISELFFHFDYIKIDKQFIDEIHSNLILIEAIIKAAHKFGIEVIAEGIELKEQHDIIKAMDCDYVQGYYFSKPLPPEKLPEFSPTKKA